MSKGVTSTGTKKTHSTHSLTKLLTKLLTHKIIHKITHLLINPLTHSLARSLTHSLTHSLTQNIQPQIIKAVICKCSSYSNIYNFVFKMYMKLNQFIFSYNKITVVSYKVTLIIIRGYFNCAYTKFKQHTRAIKGIVMDVWDKVISLTQTFYDVCIHKKRVLYVKLAR